jgi:hypothetical protein
MGMGVPNTLHMGLPKQLRGKYRMQFIKHNFLEMCEGTVFDGYES